MYSKRTDRFKVQPLYSVMIFWLIKMLKISLKRSMNAKENLFSKNIHASPAEYHLTENTVRKLQYEPGHLSQRNINEGNAMGTD